MFKVSKYIVKSVIPSNGNSRAGDTSGIGESPSRLLSFGEKSIRVRRVKSRNIVWEIVESIYLWEKDRWVVIVLYWIL